MNCETLRRFVDRCNHRTGNYTAQPHHHLLNSSHHHNTTTPDRRHILDNLYPCQLGLLVWHWKCLPLGIGDINIKHILRKNFHILEFSRIWKFGRHIKCSLIKSGFILLLANTHLVLALPGVKQWVLRRKLYACISVYCRIHVKVDLPTC